MKQFKIVHLIAALLLLLLGTLPATAAPSAPYQIVNYTIDGGGQTLGNSGDRFQLSGTIGQADSTGVLAAGPYTHSGGFWGVVTQANSTGANQLFLPIIVR
jgi:hypothetical protein